MSPSPRFAFLFLPVLGCCFVACGGTEPSAPSRARDAAAAARAPVLMLPPRRDAGSDVGSPAVDGGTDATDATRDVAREPGSDARAADASSVDAAGCAAQVAALQKGLDQAVCRHRTSARTISRK